MCSLIYDETPLGVESRILQDNLVDAMAVDALAPCVTRSSATIVLNMQDKWILDFCKEGFQLPVPSPCWEIF